MIGRLLAFTQAWNVHPWPPATFPLEEAEAHTALCKVPGGKDMNLPAGASG